MYGSDRVDYVAWVWRMMTISSSESLGKEEEDEEQRRIGPFDCRNNSCFQRGRLFLRFEIR